MLYRYLGSIAFNTPVSKVRRASKRKTQRKDHLVAPTSSLALEKYIGTNDYTVRSFPVGHIGMYVSSKVQRNLPPVIGEWLKVRAGE